MPFVTSLFAVGLALIHLYCGKLRFLDEIPRSRWLSIAGGVSVAYVFVHILPDLSDRQTHLSDLKVLSFIEYHVYLMALLGLIVFYGLEKLVKSSRKPEKEIGKETTTNIKIYWLHITSFALYNGLIGYLLVHRETTGLESLIFFFVAMSLHFLVNDYGLRQDHRNTYHKSGRWILAGSIILGWIIGTGTKISEAGLSVFFSFLAGGVIFNVLKEELPEERESRFWAFFIGAIGYSVLLLSL
ncbi:conserved hypothetical protein [Gloeothece citriformis PCC 7424]|uniref:Zinc/iron permease n=1 Tax=Gloeothece citriformis (strain PCC 7424) TaxID=65393 RepID=B7KLC0_GLOC7|nr:membrane protein [Gloeothece citriformis]ACK72492.1 conserved hypothetical protein [Gloeothece citriformis PCC 7424]